MPDSEFVKLLTETLHTNKFFESAVIPIEIKEIYCQLKNSAVKNYLRHLSLKVEENITAIKLFLTCLGDILESQGEYPAYVKLFKNYSLNIYFNDFLIQTARNCTIIPENSPMKLPLKIAYGVIRDLLQVFFGQEPTQQDQIDKKTLQQRHDALRIAQMELSISNIDNVNLGKVDSAGVGGIGQPANTDDVLSTILNIPEIRTEFENETHTPQITEINDAIDHENIVNEDIHEQQQQQQEEEKVVDAFAIDTKIDNYGIDGVDQVGTEDDSNFVLDLNKIDASSIKVSYSDPPHSSQVRFPTNITSASSLSSLSNATDFNFTADNIIFDNNE